MEQKIRELIDKYNDKIKKLHLLNYNTDDLDEENINDNEILTLKDVISDLEKLL
jgi:hypothetical protein